MLGDGENLRRFCIDCWERRCFFGEKGMLSFAMGLAMMNDENKCCYNESDTLLLTRFRV